MLLIGSGWSFVLCLVSIFYAGPPPLYRDLSLENREIRLIKIHPSLHRQRINCSLITVSLDDQPVFEALSYAWGSQYAAKSILLENHDFEVGPNLESALQHLRLADSERVIWIDALCINQKNIEERNHQVYLMRDIYMAASSVVVWLGTEANESGLGMDLIEAIADAGDAHLAQQIEAYRGPPNALSRRYVDATVMLFDREWWHRVWTVQEAVLAKELVFVCGSRLISGEKLFSASETYLRHAMSCCNYRYLTNEPAGLMSLVNSLDRVFGLNEGRNRIEQENSFLNFIVAFQNRLCSDPRDKIYGFLGLASGEWSDFLIPDYNLPPEEVLEAAALEITKKVNSLWILGFSENHSSNSTQIASWVPSWIPPQDDYIYRTSVQRRSFHRHYNACGNRALELRRLRPGIICLKGATVDRLATIGSAQFSHFNPTDNPRKIFDEWMNLAVRPNKRYMDSDLSQFDAFWMTLCNSVTYKWDESLKNDIISRIDKSTSKTRAAFGKWWSWMNSGARTNDEEMITFHKVVFQSTTARAFFVSEQGYMGLGPADIQEHDLVVVLYGGRLPYILRPTGLYLEDEYGSRMPKYRFVGTSYVQGLMDGEGTREHRKEKLLDELFLLI